MEGSQPNTGQGLLAFIQGTPSELSGPGIDSSMTAPIQQAVQPAQQAVTPVAAAYGVTPGAEGIVTPDGVMPLGSAPEGEPAAGVHPEVPPEAANLVALLAGQADVQAPQGSESEEVARLRAENQALARRSAQAAIDRANALFESAVQKKLDSGEWTEVQAVQARANRREAILNEQNRRLQDQQTAQAEQTFADRQEFFKRLHALEVTQQFGLSPDLAPLLTDANIRNRAQMEARAQGLRLWIQSQQAPHQPQNQVVQQQVQQANPGSIYTGLNPDVFVGGGDGSNPAAPVEAKPYSGDLSTLIKMTPHEIVQGY